MITTHNLPWILLACLPPAMVLSGIQDWFAGQYEVTRRGWHLSVSRRWYGVRAWVVLRTEADADEPDRYQVLAWDAEDMPAPWVRVMNIDNEDAESFWAPVTVFWPRSVRRLHPWLVRYGRLRIPALFAYYPLRQPAGFLRTDA